MQWIGYHTPYQHIQYTAFTCQNTVLVRRSKEQVLCWSDVRSPNRLVNTEKPCVKRILTVYVSMNQLRWPHTIRRLTLNVCGVASRYQADYYNTSAADYILTCQPKGIRWLTGGRHDVQNISTLFKSDGVLGVSLLNNSHCRHTSNVFW